MKSTVSVLVVVCLLQIASAHPPFLKELNKENTLDTMKGFASGFLGESIDDMGSCGTTGITILTDIDDIFNNMFHGKADTYLSTIMKMF